MNHFCDKSKVAWLASVNSIVKEFQNQPYSFLNESDIQSKIYCKASSYFSHLFGTISIPSRNYNRKSYELDFVYTEYRTKREDGTYPRIDIVSLDPYKEDGVAGMGTDVSHIYSIPIAVGIEIKYRALGGTVSFSCCREDFIKLSDLKDRPEFLVLCFAHSDEDASDLLCYRDEK